MVTKNNRYNKIFYYGYKVDICVSVSSNLNIYGSPNNLKNKKNNNIKTIKKTPTKQVNKQTKIQANKVNNLRSTGLEFLSWGRFCYIATGH